MRNLLRNSAFLAFALVAAVISTVPAQAQQKITLRYAHVGTEGETRPYMPPNWPNSSAKRRKGVLKFAFFPVRNSEI